MAPHLEKVDSKVLSVECGLDHGLGASQIVGPKCIGHDPFLLNSESNKFQISSAQIWINWNIYLAGYDPMERGFELGSF